ncbi:hypothetical protein DFS28_106123 [Pseudomonas sp. 478]|jgi:hypothetical protein|uniref:hypothetical protein n=1 Tax=unclassified Pseudomonas TaxID=196821 RepID=UPI000DABF2A7|nr:MULTISPECIES: hypothetical protein [unclassified Pseudomonas]PZW96226.1 hypothetical protein DFS28_106123 [Pseudomonas sp. 478]TCV52650.1 hypothetical protein EDB99_10594 [Pseudomonas sp. 460]
MTTYYIGSKESKAVSGELIADIQKFGKFEGVITRFITNGEAVLLNAKHVLSETSYNQITFRFPENIENKRYEFYENGPLQPPSFAEFLCSGNWVRPHYSRVDAGHITFNFDLVEGTLDAEFNFTFYENTSQVERQVVGKIKDVKGLEHVKHSLGKEWPDE